MTSEEQIKRLEERLFQILTVTITTFATIMLALIGAAVGYGSMGKSVDMAAEHVKETKDDHALIASDSRMLNEIYPEHLVLWSERKQQHKNSEAN